MPPSSLQAFLTPRWFYRGKAINPAPSPRKPFVKIGDSALALSKIIFSPTLLYYICTHINYFPQTGLQLMGQGLDPESLTFFCQ